jgi:hypothetical protein
MNANKKKQIKTQQKQTNQKGTKIYSTYHFPCHSTFGYPACFIRVARFGMSMGIALGGPGEPVLNYNSIIQNNH